MPDASEKGGALAALFRSMKKKDGGYHRVDKAAAHAESAKMASLRGDVRGTSQVKKAGKAKPKKSDY